jgi:hypothetical protein
MLRASLSSWTAAPGELAICCWSPLWPGSSCAVPWVRFRGQRNRVARVLSLAPQTARPRCLWCGPVRSPSCKTAAFQHRAQISSADRWATRHGDDEATGLHKQSGPPVDEPLLVVERLRVSGTERPRRPAARSHREATQGVEARDDSSPANSHRGSDSRGLPELHLRQPCPQAPDRSDVAPSGA